MGERRSHSGFARAATSRPSSPLRYEYAERLQATAARYGVSATYTNLETMLAEQPLDAAVVATSNASHYEVAKACLEHNLHVLVEKPLTLRAQEAFALLELAEAKKRQLIVGYSFNFLLFAKRVREVFNSGELGRVQYVQVVYSSDMTPFFQGTFASEFAVHGPAQYVDPAQLGGWARSGAGHARPGSCSFF